MMRFSLTEPVSPRYIHVNPVTNQVHLIVPVVGGQEISTDNTCKATLALKEFFDGGALYELNAYKDKLVFDIGLLELSHPERTNKEVRLKQIESYIEAIPAMQYRYSNAITVLMKKPSNLYSIQLRPREPDNASKVVNPIFHVERRNDVRDGNPLSPLYCAMYHTFPDLAIGIKDPRTKLITAVLSALPASPSFEEVQRVLQEQCDSLFGLTIDFTKRTDGTPATKEIIDEIMDFSGSEITPQKYINTLLGACALNLWESLHISPFYSIPENSSVEERTEYLSILTQFFLANLNVYCRSKNISLQNFGVILDTIPELSEELVRELSQVFSVGTDVEQVLCDFFNAHSAEFKLARPINAADVASVKQKFERNWRTIYTGENPHMDDFMILDYEATGDTAKFVTHQGSICVDFAEIIAPDLPNQAYFKHVREDFTDHPIEIPHRNEFIAADIEIEPEILLAHIDDDQLEKLPDEVKRACYTDPSYQVRHFLHNVAKGKQKEAEELLKSTPANIQNILRAKGIFTDYSGRTFNCTAYEYAYWAKDTHMCRMLETYMDEDTKVHLLAHIAEIERIDTSTGKKIGLEYKQRGITHHSAHFDLTPLKQALQEYVDNYDEWGADRNWDVMEVVRRKIGNAQRDLPAHIAQEYCRPDRSFVPKPQFNEDTLPRVLTFYNWITHRNESWFPLTASNSGLGFDSAVIRGRHSQHAEADTKMQGWAVELDLAAITRLDEVRTADLKQSRENLNPTSIGNSMKI